MSLSWRKRQAQASDQKSWRALGTDSALWKGIDKNAGNVKTALGGPAATSTDGIVTGLKLTLSEPATLNTTIGTLDIVVSDPSNSALLGNLGVNLFDTPYDASFNGVTGSGLIFKVNKYGAETFAGSALGTDISGCKFIIHNGGSGYKVGDKFSLTRINGSTNPMSGFMSAGNAVQCSVTSVASTKIEPGRN